MTSPYDLVSHHVAALLAEAGAASIPPETVATNLLAEAVRVLKEARGADDTRSALLFAIDNLEDRDFEFMRP